MDAGADLGKLVLILAVTGGFVLLGIVALVFVMLGWRREAIEAGAVAATRARELAPLLAADEKLLWEGRPVGYPKLTALRLTLYSLFAAAFVGSPLALVVTACRDFEQRDYQLAWTSFTVRSTSPKGAPIASPLAGTGTAYVTSRELTVPQPLLIVGFVAIVIGSEELRRLSSWRARRYGISDRQVLCLDPGERRLVAVPRETVTGSEVGPRTLTITTADRRVVFAGIDDPRAACSHLAPPPSPAA